MPLKDGFVAASEMRRLPIRNHPTGQLGGATSTVMARPKIIAITALSDPRDRMRGLNECGIDEWRTKPISIRTLQQDLAKWYSAWKTEQQGVGVGAGAGTGSGAVAAVADEA